MQRLSHTLSAAAAAGLLAFAVPAGAQQPIRLGQTVTSSLEASDPRVSAADSSHYKLYVYHGNAGEAIRVTMKSGAFDSYLSLGQVTGGSFRGMRSNDDGAGGTDSQLDFVLPTTGDYAIRANSVSAATGPFTLMVERGVAPGPVVNHAISMGQTVSGTLAEGGPQEQDGTFYDQYVVRGRAGQTVQVTMRSGAVDSYLNIGTLSGGQFTSAKTDDDGAGNNDARIVYTFPSDGDYAIHANTLSRATGAYTLTVEPGTPPPPVVNHDISVNQTVNGSLDASDPKDTDNSSFDQYVIHGRAGQRLTVTLRSSAFDSYLHFGRMVNGAYSEIKADDDSAGGNDSQVEVTLDADGDYVIRANSLMAAATGAYSLTVAAAK
ncbi:MAG TPA: hypothetical protein VFE05_13805 [Longimicrobiaceae bacterium]|jgi:hypothetical protein|nr:hypothetical protein [Longimicrobiaceae bacterium]